MTKERQYILKNMREGDKEYTKSQLRIFNFLKKFYDSVEMECVMNGLEEVDGIKPTIPPPKVDIVIHWSFKYGRIAIRVMGEIHENPRQKIKDEDQRVVLEGNGWKVEDLWYDDFPKTFFGTDEESEKELQSWVDGELIRKRM